VKKIDAPAPEGVSLHRDEYGIPHIVTGDLAGAYWGMGYAHAMDRGAQIGLMRLLGQGRVAECLDGSDESVEIDTFFRRMNWFGNTAGQVDLSPRRRRASSTRTATVSTPGSTRPVPGSSVRSVTTRSRGPSRTCCSWPA